MCAIVEALRVEIILRNAQFSHGYDQRKGSTVVSNVDQGDHGSNDFRLRNEAFNSPYSDLQISQCLVHLEYLSVYKYHKALIKQPSL